MNPKEELFERWAPEGATWSPWAKPVVFASMSPSMDVGSMLIVPDLASFEKADGSTAVVINLPGAEGVGFGVALSEKGYRPVPLYNAVPSPTPPATVTGLESAVDVRTIARALVSGSTRLATHLHHDSPPAFLIDWNRRGNGVSPGPGRFDNRSVSFTTDFPSGTRLRAQRIRRVVLVQPQNTNLQEDLSHTLLRWQEAGLVIERTHPESASRPSLIIVPKPTWFGAACQRALAAVGLRRSLFGGFGDWVPMPSSSVG